MAIKALMLAVATVLTVYGIETGLNGNIVPCWGVATVLTVYGIETSRRFYSLLLPLRTLQQYLPFTVLKQE